MFGGSSGVRQSQDVRGSIGRSSYHTTNPNRRSMQSQYNESGGGAAAAQGIDADDD